jgi:hypothetical protein
MDEIEVVVDSSVGGENPKFEGTGWAIDERGTLTVCGARQGTGFKQLGSFNVGKWITVTRLGPAKK